MFQIRAIDIAIFVLILNASVVFVADVELFDANYLDQTDLSRNQYSSYTIEDNLSEFENVSANPSTWDYFKMSVAWAIEAFVWFIKIVFAVVFIYPVLVEVFGIPGVLSGFLQIGIYSIYLVGLFQWKAKISAKHMI